MKKIIFILSAFSIVLFFVFAKSHTNSFPKSEKRGTCTIPTNLTATKNGGSVTLSWSEPDPVNCSYGGYFNISGGNTQNFGGSTNTWPISISCPSDAISMHYSVTANCNDGTHSYSDAVFIYF